MTWPTFAPALILTALSLLLGWRALPLHPSWSARILVISGVSTALAVLSTVLLVAAVFIAGFLPPEAVLGWGGKGHLLLDHGPVPVHLGAMALVLLGVGLYGTVRLGVGMYRDIRMVRDAPGSVTDQERPIALAVPGYRGGVLVSRGLMRLLTRDQLQVVFRHEHAHLRHRHHVYTTLGALSAAVFPPLGTLQKSLRLALERWADEDAAQATGSRELVAHTIARVALAAPDPRPTWHLALADSHVVQRVRALLGEAPSGNPVAGPALLGSTGVASSGIASSCFQLHHFAALLLL
ncbi:M56 family metallopeptidase [Nocardiopsis sp. NPDC006139]|uniref:M56 family metallopeptidase n=1 Tax=Nocardiopsis sp. NPDC006139 TaxID=3154578 RepID=UPI0033A6808E